MLNRLQPLIALSFALFATGASGAAVKSDVAKWTVNDLTGIIALASVEDRDTFLTLSFQNKSRETVTAVALSFRENAHHYQDWLNAESSGLAPGQTFSLTIGPEESADGRVTISAVLFEDGSGKGNLPQLDLMNFHRYGQALEGTRIGTILRARSASPDDAGLSALTKNIGRIPTSSDEAMASLDGVRVPGISLDTLKRSGEKLRNALYWGVSTTRERALRQLDNVRQLPVLSRDESIPSRGTVLAFIQDQYDKQNKKAGALFSRRQRGQQ